MEKEILARLSTLKKHELQEECRTQGIEPGDMTVDEMKYHLTNIKLREQALIAVKQYPRFDFVGEILGPQGNTSKQLQEETGAKISVFGKETMRVKAKKEEQHKGCDPKYAHLNWDLHVISEVFGPPCEAYALMACALEKVQKFLILKSTKFRTDGD
ncbi:UNVERIFIED_CONTAM: KH domain-containing, RNA-binding, signal transduction-associated protein 1 [Gekko kuhli]